MGDGRRSKKWEIVVRVKSKIYPKSDTVSSSWESTLPFRFFPPLPQITVEVGKTAGRSFTQVDLTRGTPKHCTTPNLVLAHWKSYDLHPSSSRGSSRVCGQGRFVFSTSIPQGPTNRNNHTRQKPLPPALFRLVR